MLVKRATGGSKGSSISGLGGGTFSSLRFSGFPSFSLEFKLGCRCRCCGIVSHFFMWPGPWFNIKMSSYQYRKSHCGDKTVVRSSYLHNGISYTGKMTSLYWFSPLNSSLTYFYLPNLEWAHCLSFRLNYMEFLHMLLSVLIISSDNSKGPVRLAQHSALVLSVLGSYMACACTDVLHGIIDMYWSGDSSCDTVGNFDRSLRPDNNSTGLNPVVQ